MNVNEICPDCGSRNVKINYTYDPFLSKDILEYECRECGEVWNADLDD